VDGKDVLTQGIIRRIGSGATTNIWNQNWLSRKGVMKPLCCTGDHPPARVSELIDHTTGTWRRDQLEEHFISIDREVIESISLSTRNQDDFWAWSYGKTGVFSVRSAYRMLVHNRESRSDWIEHSAGKSDIRAEEKEWCQLWNVQVPSKL
jgi:hypothetical protein